MNDKSLVSFVTAAEKGSFYKAAQVLFTTPQNHITNAKALKTIDIIKQKIAC